MSKCCICDSSLHDSKTEERNGVEYKSCPKCSVTSSVHIFYRTEVFGYRDMGDGRHIVQSWCPSCRSGDNPHIPEAFRCK